MNLKTGKFVLLRSLHRWTVLAFSADFDNLALDSFSKTYEYMYNDMENLFKQLLRHFRGMKVSISILADLQDLHSDKYIKDRKFLHHFSKFVTKTLFKKPYYCLHLMQ